MSIATQIERLQGVRDQIRTKMVSLGLSENTDLLQNLADDLDGIQYRGNASTTLSTSTRSKTLDAGYYTGGTIKVPSDYFPVNSTNTTATASDVLSGKTFVSTSGSTVTGTIATASSSDVSGDVKGADPTKITLTAAKTSGSSSTTATAKAIVTKGLYTGSSNIEKSLTSKTITATAEATLAGTNGAIELTAGTSAFTKKSTADYSDGFITSVKVNPTPSEEKTATPSNTVQTVTPAAGKLLSKVTVNAIPSPYFNTSGVTATAGTVLKDYKFVNSSGATVTGTIATATSSNVSGSVSGSNPGKITLTTEKTSGSSSTTATASATVAKGLYTGSSNIEKSLTSQDFTATAEAKLATSVSDSKTIPGTLPPGTVTITPNTDNTKRIYSDSKNKGFVTNIVLNAMDTSSVSSATTTDPGTDYVNKATVTPSTSAQYIKITKGYLPNSKITVNKMADGSLSSATTTDPGDSYANRVTVTPSGTDAQYVKISAGYLPNSKITINKMASGSVSSASTTNPGDSYANQTTVTPSTSAQYVKVTAGYLPNSKITINKMADGSVSSATTTNPGDSYTNKATVTPTKSTQYVKIAAGYLPNSKVTVNAIPSATFTIATSAWSAMSPVNETGSYTCTISGVTGVTATNDIVVLPGSTSVVASCGVYASGQGAGSITFKAFDKPTSNISYTVYILNS